MKTLDLVLKHHWYDMIASGEKKEEYREIKPYWIKRLIGDYKITNDPIIWDGIVVKATMHLEIFKPQYTLVKFHRGYTNTTMTFEIKSIGIGKGNPKWGAPEENVFIIKLGNHKIG